MDFDQTEWWGAEVDVEYDGERYERLRIRFFVQDRTAAPMIGEPVPRTVQKVLGDVESIDLIDTSRHPNPSLHQQTVAEALDSGLPLVIGLATPLFCQTRFCGPVVQQVIKPLSERYGDRVAVLHIEPFDIERARTGQLVPVPMMAEWGLQTEPWIFVVEPDPVFRTPSLRRRCRPERSPECRERTQRGSAAEPLSWHGCGRDQSARSRPSSVSRSRPCTAG